MAACDSWDNAADIMRQRVDALKKADLAKQHGAVVRNTPEQQAMVDRIEQINKDNLPNVRW